MAICLDVVGAPEAHFADPVSCFDEFAVEIKAFKDLAWA
jgi:hypothetical protein